MTNYLTASAPNTTAAFQPSEPSGFFIASDLKLEYVVTCDCADCIASRGCSFDNMQSAHHLDTLLSSEDL